MAGLSWIEALEYYEEQVSLRLVHLILHLEENINREVSFRINKTFCRIQDFLELFKTNPQTLSVQ